MGLHGNTEEPHFSAREMVNKDAPYSRHPIWTMVTKKVPFKPPTDYLFLDQKRKLKVMQRIKKNIAKFDIKPEDVGFGNLLNLSYDF